MSTTTTNLSLVKPERTDRVDITVIDDDLDLIDAAVASRISTSTFKKLRVRDTASRSIGKVPSLMASPPTVTSRSRAYPFTTGTAIASPKMYFADSASFACRGGTASYTLFGGSVPAIVSAAYSSGQTSRSPFTVAFRLNSVLGTIEVVTKNGSGTSMRVLVDGEYVTFPDATFLNSTNDGGATIYSIEVGTGWRDVEIEAAGGATFLGIIAGPNDTIRPSHFKPRQKWAWVGASFEESTVVDSSSTTMSSWGYPKYVGQMLGVDVVTCAKGGTGYINPGPGVKMHDRLSDLTDLAPDVVVWGGSMPMNDEGYGSYSQATQAAQIAACFDDVTAALPNAVQIVLGPFWTRGRLVMPGRIFEVRDTLKTAADSRGFPYIEMLAPAPPSTVLTPAATTLTSSTNAGATSIVCPGQLLSTASYQIVAGQTIIQIGSGATAELRAIQTRTAGSGTWTYGVNDAGNSLAYAHDAGEPVTVVADGFVTGTGTQTHPSGSGNADLFVGGDSTHPTMAGHVNLAEYVYSRLTLLLDA